MKRADNYSSRPALFPNIIRFLLPPLCILPAMLWLAGAPMRAQELSDPRMPAEWEQVQGVVIGWGDFVGDDLSMDLWTPLIRQVRRAEMTSLARVAEAALDEGIAVYVIDPNGDALDSLQVLGVESDLIFPVPSERQTIWLRDHGPFSVYRNGADSLYLMTWPGDGGGESMIDYLGIPSRRVDLGASVSQIGGGVYYTDGGNLMTDGSGRMFLDAYGGERSQIPDYASITQQVMRDSLGIGTFVELPAYTVHTDYYMKLIDEETILVADIPASNYIGYEPRQDDNERIAEAVEYIRDNFTGIYGRSYRFVTLTNVPSVDDPSRNLTALTADLSYTNSLILNGTVLVPTFENAERDEAALEIYRREMLGYRVVGIPFLEIGSRGGAVHCVTREIAAAEPVLIRHAWYPDTVYNNGEAYEIRAEVLTASGVSGAALHWSINGGDFQTVLMQKDGGTTFTAEIPQQTSGSLVRYYLTATAMNGRTGIKPIVAPEGVYSFRTADEVSGAVVGDERAAGLALAVAPNPLNGAGRVDLWIPTPQHVRVELVDPLGRRVCLLKDGIAEAGGERLRLDGTALPAGQYYLHVVSQGKGAVKVVNIVK